MKLLAFIFGWLTLALPWVTLGQDVLQSAEREYELLNYAKSITLFEKSLQEDLTLTGTEKLGIKLKLAYAYKQQRDAAAAEKMYREALSPNPRLTVDQVKHYMYYAQVLASNLKYKESDLIFEKYQTYQKEAERVTSYKAEKETYVNEAKYQIEYLNINSQTSDFSPVFYKDGLVFCSGRGGAGRKGLFLDLFYLPDLGMLAGREVGFTAGSSQVAPKLGQDKYTMPTANDTPTLARNNVMPFTANETIVRGLMNFSGTINTLYNEGPCTFTPDGQTIFFTRNSHTDGKYRDTDDRTNKLKIYTSRIVNGNWGTPSEAALLNSNEFSSGHPALSPDGKWLYFISDMPGGMGGTDLFVVSYKNGLLGKIQNLGQLVNTNKNEMFPFVDAQGNLYFASDGWNGKGGLDLYFVEMKDGKPQGRAVNLGEPINSTFDDFGILTNPSRSVGYFSSNRRNGKSDDDIYRFTRKAVGGVYACKELTIRAITSDEGQGIAATQVKIEAIGGKTDIRNTDARGEFKFCLERDREYLLTFKKEGFIQKTIGYLVKGQHDNAPARIETALERIPTVVNQVDILVEKDTLTALLSDKSATRIEVPVSDEAAANNISGRRSLFRGRAIDPLTKEILSNADIRIRLSCQDSTTNELMMRTDSAGYYNLKFPEGCDLELIPDVADEDVVVAPIKIRAAPVTASTSRKTTRTVVIKDLAIFRKGTVITTENVNYDNSTNFLTGAVTRELDRLIAILKTLPNMAIEIGVHTDSRGSSDANFRQSETRAREAVAYMVNRGIPSGRLLARGYGESQLLNRCGDAVRCADFEHQQNRRMTLKIIKVK
jgi:outer membrane protein OmpA-like peptidoglycan-associated protein/tetratricopeptide (TPR) repeat protein